MKKKTKEEALHYMRVIIRRNFETQAAFAKRVGVSPEQLSMALSTKQKVIPQWLLTACGMKKTIIYEVESGEYARRITPL